MAELTELEQKSLSEIPHPALAEGSSIYGGTKVFPDYQAENGEVYFRTIGETSKQPDFIDRWSPWYYRDHVRDWHPRMLANMTRLVAIAEMPSHERRARCGSWRASSARRSSGWPPPGSTPTAGSWRRWRRHRSSTNCRPT